MSKTQRKCIVDVGSNSVLTLIAQQTPDGWAVLSDDAKVTALGEGVKRTGQLNQASIGATLEELRTASEKAKSFGASFHAFGTMALRIAKNAEHFLADAKAQLTPVEVISGELEAELSLRAVLEDKTFNNSNIITVLDIGGHSTEIASSAKSDSDWKEALRVSRAVGTLMLLDEVGTDEELTGRDLIRCAAIIDDVIGFRYLPHRCGTVVVLGATGTNLASTELGLETWQPEKVHGCVLEYGQISKAAANLCRMSVKARAGLRGIEPGRERTIHMGALILERSLFMVGAERCSVSVRGWRHAMLSRV